MDERAFLHALRALPLHPGARELRDDTATLAGLVVTTDTMVEGVHFLPSDPADEVAWRLLATNLSDLAAKGALVEGVLLNYPLSEAVWDTNFLAGFDQALRRYGARVLGGDTVSLPPGAPRVLTLTAFGTDAAAPPRSGARAGDALWVTGTIGDALPGLEIARTGCARDENAAWLLARYRRPTPRLIEGRALARSVHAMMDVSDGLLIDAARMAEASGLSVTIDLAAVPLSMPARATDLDPLAAATAGDDYELLFAAPPDWSPPVPATRVGVFALGRGLSLVQDGASVALPTCLGYQHNA